MNIKFFEEYMTKLLLMKNIEEWHPYGMTVPEYTYLYSIVVKRRPCNMLVFGVGFDGVLWNETNKGGNTVFLENNPVWIKRLSEIRDPSSSELQVVTVSYGTKKNQYKNLLRRFKKGKKNVLEMNLPPLVENTPWDIIFVDAPKNREGRMKSIYTASILKGDEKDILVHDCNRKIEKFYIDEFLKKKIHQVQKLGHYKIK